MPKHRLSSPSRIPTQRDRRPGRARRAGHLRRAAALLAAITFAAPASAQSSVSLAAWSAALPPAFVVTGVKNEPTYLAAIEIRRDGDAFSVVGGAPAWARRARQAMSIAPDGTLRGGDGKPVESAAGFLATAGLVAAARHHRLAGEAPITAFGDRQVVCIAGERLGIPLPILDPCFDVESGAAIAQRHRLSGAFDGPSLDPSSLHISVSSATTPSP